MGWPSLLLIVAMLAFAVAGSAAMILQFRDDPPTGTGSILLGGAFFGLSTLTAYIVQA